MKLLDGASVVYFFPVINIATFDECTENYLYFYQTRLQLCIFLKAKKS